LESKSGRYSGQVGSGERSESKPFDDAPIVGSAVKTGSESGFRDKCAGDLVTGRAAAGVKGA